ncbi:hypothetical protein L484_008012 [Morus notabilis]|uniref:Uncharacterized protein n=1 Tax=Morus notabilis TaxID=981085 RepID=W9QJ77_9ROSA|nr:hypothetical protein L484_008012 [Morus notabilis]
MRSEPPTAKHAENNGPSDNNPFSSAIPIQTLNSHNFHPFSSSPPSPSPQPPPQQSQEHSLVIPPTTPYKRPLPNPNNSSPLSKSPTLYKLRNDAVRRAAGPTSLSAKAVVFRLVRRVNRLRRLVILVSLPFFYFLVSHPSHSFLLDFLSAFAFSAALLLSLNLALPRLPSIRLFLSRSLPLKLISPSSISRPPLPVFWSIGSRAARAEKRPNSSSGCWVQVYRNGDVYEGEFHKGKCSGSGVYYYYMSGRYEGDWVDGKYDGYGVETWARGSRYRGQYRQGLRHGFGVYRFYTGDVYAGEWSNGQSHGCGVHTCDDGSRYVGEFKWGVKHGLGHYHFSPAEEAMNLVKHRMTALVLFTLHTHKTKAPIVSKWGVRVVSYHQEARRAAEKAYDVAKVDERVNRAVAAANRAANAARVAAVKAVQKQMHQNSNNDNIPIPVLCMYTTQKRKSNEYGVRKFEIERREDEEDKWRP